jgi:hypothetical protein
MSCEPGITATELTSSFANVSLMDNSDFSKICEAELPFE